MQIKSKEVLAEIIKDYFFDDCFEVLFSLEGEKRRYFESVYAEKYGQVITRKILKKEEELGYFNPDCIFGYFSPKEFMAWIIIQRLIANFDAAPPSTYDSYMKYGKKILKLKNELKKQQKLNAIKPRFDYAGLEGDEQYYKELEEKKNGTYVPPATAPGCPDEDIFTSEKYSIVPGDGAFCVRKEKYRWHTDLEFMPSIKKAVDETALNLLESAEECPSNEFPYPFKLVAFKFGYTEWLGFRQDIELMVEELMADSNNAFEVSGLGVAVSPEQILKDISREVDILFLRSLNLKELGKQLEVISTFDPCVFDYSYFSPNTDHFDSTILSFKGVKDRLLSGDCMRFTGNISRTKFSQFVVDIFWILLFHVMDLFLRSSLRTSEVLDPFVGFVGLYTFIWNILRLPLFFIRDTFDETLSCFRLIMARTLTHLHSCDWRRKMNAKDLVMLYSFYIEPEVKGPCEVDIGFRNRIGDYAYSGDRTIRFIKWMSNRSYAYRSWDGAAINDCNKYTEYKIK